MAATLERKKGMVTRKLVVEHDGDEIKIEKTSTVSNGKRSGGRTEILILKRFQGETEQMIRDLIKWCSFEIHQLTV